MRDIGIVSVLLTHNKHFWNYLQRKLLQASRFL